MIKFRAWSNLSKAMHEVLAIDWVTGMVKLDCALSEQPFEAVVLEESTGIKDVNGKYIYEGDIVRYTRWADHIGIVRYFKPEFCLQNVGANIDIAPTLTMRHELRIIGNVHENLELLKG